MLLEETSSSSNSCATQDVYISPIQNIEKTSTKLGALIRKNANLSISQTLKVLKTLHLELNDDRLKPPSRSGLYDACNRNLSSINASESDCGVLQFDGKTYQKVLGKEKISVIAICIDGKLIGFEDVENKKALTIFETINNVLQKHNITPKIVISDTEPTNTGIRNGVIVQLKKEFFNLEFEPCRIHILDLVLKHQFSAYFPEKTTSAELPYAFTEKISKSWKELKNTYLSTCSKDEADEVDELPKNENRRKDYLLLLKFTKAVIHKRKYNICPFISNFPNQPPSISNARWNSRAIFSLFAELLQFSDDRIYAVNSFIVEVKLLLLKIKLHNLLFSHGHKHGSL